MAAIHIQLNLLLKEIMIIDEGLIEASSLTFAELVCNLYTGWFWT